MEITSLLSYLGMRTRREETGLFHDIDPNDDHIPDITVLNPPPGAGATSPMLIDNSLTSPFGGIYSDGVRRGQVAVVNKEESSTNVVTIIIKFLSYKIVFNYSTCPNFHSSQTQQQKQDLLHTDKFWLLLIIPVARER